MVSSSIPKVCSDWLCPSLYSLTSTQLYDLSSGSMLCSILFGFSLTAVAMDAAERWLFVGGATGQIEQVNLFLQVRKPLNYILLIKWLLPLQRTSLSQEASGVCVGSGMGGGVGCGMGGGVGGDRYKGHTYVLYVWYHSVSCHMMSCGCHVTVM